MSVIARRARRHRSTLSLVVPLVVVLVAGVACGTATPRRDGPGGAVGAAISVDRETPSPSTARPAGTLQLPKAQLQSTLDALFADHVRLVLGVTGATANGQTERANELRVQLDENTDDIVGAVVGVYGPDAAVFGEGWRMHVQAFADYAAAGAANDEAKKADARRRLDKYPKQVGAFLAGANPHLAQPAVADLVASHIADITGVIDQQVAGAPTATDPSRSAPSHAAAHMTDLATALTNAIAQQFPTRFPT